MGFSIALEFGRSIAAVELSAKFQRDMTIAHFLYCLLITEIVISATIWNEFEIRTLRIISRTRADNESKYISCDVNVNLLWEYLGMATEGLVIYGDPSLTNRWWFEPIKIVSNKAHGWKITWK